MIKIDERLDLSVAERILMIEKIWDSIEHDAIPSSAKHEHELNRRLHRHKNGETTFVKRTDIKNELNKR